MKAIFFSKIDFKHSLVYIPFMIRRAVNPENVHWIIMQDIAGFTSLSEKLAEKGTEGTENLTDILQRFFKECESTIEKTGGRLFDLAGDAYFAFAPGILSCGDMNKIANKLLNSIVLKQSGLKSRIVAVRGPLDILDVRVTHGWDILPSGYSVTRLMQAEEEAYSDIFVEDTAPQLKGSDTVPPAHPLDISDMETSHRPGVILFLYLKNPESRFMTNISETLVRNIPGAWLDNWMPYLNGAMGMFLFGVPQATGVEVDQAVETAIRVRELLQGNKCSFGIASGIVFAGITGGKTFRDFTLIGDPTNLAARLAVKAEIGEILLTGNEKEKTRAPWKFTDKGMLKVKGRRKEVELFSVSEESESPSKLFPYPMINHEKELKIINEILINNRRGGFIGEPGAGKSRLLHEAEKMAFKTKTPLLYGIGTPNRIPFSVLKNLVSSLPVEILADYPLLKKLTDPSFELDRSLKAFLINSLRDIICRLGAILMLDDMHWIDNPSLELITEVLAKLEENTCSLLGTSRPEGKEVLKKLSIEGIEVSNLKGTDLRKFAEAVLGGNISEQLLNYLSANSEGIPFIAEQLLLYMKENNAVKIEKDVWTIVTNTGNLPDTVFSVILSRIDRFPAKLVKTLEIASCIGREIDIKILETVTGEKVFESLDPDGAGNLIVKEQSVYLFKHALVREAIYDSLLHRQKIRYHRKIASCLQNTGASPYETALHWERANNPLKADRFWYEAFNGLIGSGFVTEAEAIIPRMHSGTTASIMEGRALIHKGKFDEAEAVLIPLMRRLKNGPRRTDLIISIIELYDWSERYVLMHKWLLKTGKCRLTPDQEISIHNKWGIYYDMTGNSSPALKNYNLAQKACIKYSGKRSGSILFNIGWIYRCRLDFDRARKFFIESIEVDDNPFNSAWSEQRLGECDLAENNYDAAKIRFERALSLFEKMDFPFGQSISLAYLSVHSVLNGHIDKALTLAKKAEETRIKMGDKHGYYRFNILMASARYREAGVLAASADGIERQIMEYSVQRLSGLKPIKEQIECGTPHIADLYNFWDAIDSGKEPEHPVGKELFAYMKNKSKTLRKKLELREKITSPYAAYYFLIPAVLMGRIKFSSK